MLQQIGIDQQGVHPKLQELYDGCNKGHQVVQPSDSKLRNTLNIIIQQYNSGCIVLDALDECNVQERANIIKWVANSSAKMHIAVTSRYLPEGPAANIGLIIALEAHGSKIKDDISLYLEDQILDHFEGELKDRVLDTLKHKAQGQ